MIPESFDLGIVEGAVLHGGGGGGFDEGVVSGTAVAPVLNGAGGFEDAQVVAEVSAAEAGDAS